MQSSSQIVITNKQTLSFFTGRKFFPSPTNSVRRESDSTLLLNYIFNSPTVFFVDSFSCTPAECHPEDQSCLNKLTSIILGYEGTCFLQTCTVSPPQPDSVTVDDFGPQAANATSSREHDSNSASAASPLLVRQLGTAFRHQFKN